MVRVLALLPALETMVIAAFSDTISFGSVIVGGLVAIGTLVMLLFGVKYRVLADQQGLTIANLSADRDTWKDMAVTRQTEVDRLDAGRQQLVAEVATLKEDKARLEALPNLNVILEYMRADATHRDEAARGAVQSIVEAFTQAMQNHEDAAARRHKELVEVLRPQTQPKG